MPQAIPVIIAFAVKVGTAIAAIYKASMLVRLAVHVALAIAVGLIAKSMAQPQMNQGQEITLKIDPSMPRQIAVGRTMTGGSLAWAYVENNGGGSDYPNRSLHRVIVLSDRPINGLVNVYAGNQVLTFNGDVSTGFRECNQFRASKSGEARMWMRLHKGSDTATADTDLMSWSNGHWTSAHKGTGLAYVIVNFSWDQSAFPQGEPQLAFEVDGAKVYDDRHDVSLGGTQNINNPATWAYSRNASVITAQLLRGFKTNGKTIMGADADSRDLDPAMLIAAANTCDQSVSLAGGGTEPRYKAGLLLTASNSVGQELSALQDAMDGRVYDRSGAITILPGGTRTPVMNLTDEDIIWEDEKSYQPLAELNSLYNVVMGRYVSEARQYTEEPYPITQNSTYIDDDGTRIVYNKDFRAVTSFTQVQRIVTRILKSSRFQTVIGFNGPLWLAEMEQGDWFTLTSARWNFDTKYFQIESFTVTADLRVVIGAKETSSTIDGWSTADEVPRTDDTTSNPAPGVPTPVLTVGNTSVSGAGDTILPAIQYTITPTPGEECAFYDLELRKQDTPAVVYQLPSLIGGQLTGQYAQGILQDTTYEVRARGVSSDGVNTSAWTIWVPATTGPEFKSNDSGSLGGTTATVVFAQIAAAQASADSASTDGVLTPAEKRYSLMPLVNLLRQERDTGAMPQAAALGLSGSTAYTNYSTAMTTLESYLATLTTPVLYSNYTGNTTISSPSTYTTNIDTAVQRLTELHAAIDQSTSTTATWPNITGTGKPSDNAGAVITMTAMDTNTPIQGNTFTKTAGGNVWTTGAAYSVNKITNMGGVFFQVGDAAHLHAVGLTDTPGTAQSYTNIDYAWYFQADGTCHIYESGTDRGAFGSPYIAADHFGVTYDGGRIIYWKNGTIVRTVTTTTGRSFAIQYSPNTVGASVKGVMLFTFPVGSFTGFNLFDSGGLSLADLDIKTVLGIASGITGQGAFATVNTAAYGSSLLTGFGSLAPLSNLYFGSAQLLEASGGSAATLANFKTILGIASGITGQGTGATANNLSQLNTTEGAKLAKIEAGAAVGDNLIRNAVLKDDATDWNFVGSAIRVASTLSTDPVPAFIRQAVSVGDTSCYPNGTSSDVSPDSNLMALTGGQKIYWSYLYRTDSARRIIIRFRGKKGDGTTTGTSTASDVNSNTSDVWTVRSGVYTIPAGVVKGNFWLQLVDSASGTHTDISAFRVATTQYLATVGAQTSVNLLRDDGATILAQSEVRTAEGIASGILGQGAFATLNSAAYGSGLLTGFGTLSPLNNLYFGSSQLTEDAPATIPATLANFKTGLGTAAAFTGQGSLSLLNTILASNLTLGDPSNMVRDSGFADTAWWTLTAGASYDTSTNVTTQLSAPKGIKFTASGANPQADDTATGGSMQVEPNKYYRVSLRANQKVGYKGRIEARVIWLNQSGGTISTSTLAGTDYRTTAVSGADVISAYEGLVQAPSTAYAAKFIPASNWPDAAASAGSAYVSTPRMNRAADSNFLTANAVQLGLNITKADGSTPLTDLLAVTSLGVAAAITSQGLLATRDAEPIATGTVLFDQTTSGSWSFPKPGSGSTAYLIIEMWGAGGSGANSTNDGSKTVWTGYGGGGGGYIKHKIALGSAPTTLAGTVGAGGQQANGGNTTLTSPALTAGGGVKATQKTAGTNTGGSAGTGGTASGGSETNTAGRAGGLTNQWDGGGAGNGGGDQTTQSGAGTSPGGGGAGGGYSESGHGADGRVRITASDT